MTRRPPRSTLFPSTPLFRSQIPIALLRSSRGKTFEMIESVAGMISAPPTPIAARTAISWADVSTTRTARLAVPKRSEEHTSELQSQSNLVCRLLLEKTKPRRIGVHRHHSGLAGLRAVEQVHDVPERVAHLDPPVGAVQDLHLGHERIRDQEPRPEPI